MSNATTYINTPILLNKIEACKEDELNIKFTVMNAPSTGIHTVFYRIIQISGLNAGQVLKTGYFTNPTLPTNDTLYYSGAIELPSTIQSQASFYLSIALSDREIIMDENKPIELQYNELNVENKSRWSECVIRNTVLGYLDFICYLDDIAATGGIFSDIDIVTNNSTLTGFITDSTINDELSSYSIVLNNKEIARNIVPSTKNVISYNFQSSFQSLYIIKDKYSDGFPLKINFLTKKGYKGEKNYIIKFKTKQMSSGGVRTVKAMSLYGITKKSNTYTLNLNNIKKNTSNVVFPFSTITKNNCARFNMTVIGKTLDKSDFEKTLPDLVIAENDVANYNITLEEKNGSVKITSETWQTQEWPQLLQEFQKNDSYPQYRLTLTEDGVTKIKNAISTYVNDPNNNWHYDESTSTYKYEGDFSPFLNLLTVKNIFSITIQNIPELIVTFDEFNARNCIQLEHVIEEVFQETVTRNYEYNTIIFRKNLLTNEQIIIHNSTKTQQLQRDDGTKIIDTYYDYLVESGVPYEYSAEIILTKIDSIDQDTSKYKLAKCKAENVYDYTYLMDNQHCLQVQFDENISNLKYNVQDVITQTLGGKYPYVRRNGNMNYRTFEVGGIISYLSNPSGMSEEQINDSSLIAKSTYTESFNSSFFENISFEESNLSGRDLEILKEKEFRDQVINFLYNDNVKLFKSPTEGNMLVRLTNVSLTPKQELGRMIYSFNAQATEAAEATEENLKKYLINREIDREMPLQIFQEEV